MRDELENFERELGEDVLALLATRPRELEDVTVLKAKVQGSLNAKPSRKQISVFRYLSVAAAVVIIAIGIKYIPTNKTVRQPTTYSTTTGQRATVTLADGSRATLAPSTTIRVTGRDVELKGQALFTVTQHTSTPFTVRTGKTVTRVLGTTFGVRAYDSNVTVAVSDGKVAVNTATLSAGDAVNVRGDTTSVIHNANVTSILSWTSGQLVFDRTPAPEVADELERWFGLDIKLTSEKLSEQQVTVVLDTNNSRESIALFVSLLNARAAVKGNTVTLTPISQ